MNRLHVYEEQPKLVYAFKDFIEVIEDASASYHEITANNSGVTGETRFNMFPSIDKYQVSLKSIFSRMVREIDESVNERYAKLEKLNLLSRHLIEVKSLQDLYHTGSGNITHQAFTFSNLATSSELKKTIIEQEQVQGYLSAGFNMVIKIQRYIEELKHNVELTRQEDFVLPASMAPDPNESSLENPMAYFEYLIAKNGVFRLLNDFKPSEDDYGYGYIGYDEETQTKTSEEQDPETGEWETLSYKFADHLYSILVRQFNKAKDCMDTAVHKFTNKKGIKLAIELWLSQLTYLKTALDQNKYLKKYEVMGKPVEAMIRYLYEKYGSFCPKPNKLAQTLLEKSKLYELPEAKQLALPQAIQPGMFRWLKGDPQRNSFLLHGALNKSFIQDTTLDDFHVIFAGGYPDESFKIRWIDRTPNGKHINKVTLLYLFKQLADKGLIDIPFDSKEMFVRLSRIFVDGKGQMLNNLPQSKANVLNAKKEDTDAKSEIDKMIRALTG